MAKTPEGRGGEGELAQEFGKDGEAPAKEIGGEGRRWWRCSAATALWRGRRGKEGRGVERRSWRIFYRA
jgi:hypothetical protein